MSTESIKNRLQIVKDISDEMKKIKALYDEVLEDDHAFVGFQEDASKIREDLKIRKSKILSDPKFAEYEQQIKELKDDLTENKEILYQELADYYKESGNLEIIGPDGNKKRMKFTVKLVSTFE